MSPQVSTYGPHCVLCEWDDEVSHELQSIINQYGAYVEDLFFKEVVETVITYKALAIYLRSHVSVEPFIAKLENAEILGDPMLNKKRIVMVPVCYETEFAPDLERVSAIHNLTPEQVIDIHLQASYQVAFTGFLPGFAYLNGLPSKLHTPRLETPRKRIHAGSVGIGGQQTGIYPQDSPGGWNIIGRCPLRLFDTNSQQICLFQAGDHVRFQRISATVFDQIKQLVAKELYHPQISWDD